MAMEKFLNSPNESKLTGITHAKFLCLVSVLGNKTVDGKRVEKLISKNTRAWKDVYYRSIVRRSSGVLVRS